MQGHPHDVKRSNRKDQQQNSPQQKKRTHPLPQEAKGEHQNTAGRTNHGSITQGGKAVGFVPNPDATELDNEDGQEQNQTPTHELFIPALLNIIPEEVEKSIPEHGQGSIPIHFPNGHGL